jgi:phosphoribosylamine--glycine ligase
LVEIFKAISEERLDEINLEIDQRAATTVMLVSGGYPEAYEKGKEISGLENINDSLVFHAGATIKNNKVVTSGGRVMAITSYGNTYEEAIKKSYQNINQLHFDKMYYRKDIGFDL